MKKSWSPMTSLRAIRSTYAWAREVKRMSDVAARLRSTGASSGGVNPRRIRSGEGPYALAKGPRTFDILRVARLRGHRRVSSLRGGRQRPEADGSSSRAPRALLPDTCYASDRASFARGSGHVPCWKPQASTPGLRKLFAKGVSCLRPSPSDDIRDTACFAPCPLGARSRWSPLRRS